LNASLNAVVSDVVSPCFISKLSGDYISNLFLDQVFECKLVHAVLNSTVLSTTFDIVNKRKEIEKREDRVLIL
jgi:hypothetical protein